MAAPLFTQAQDTLKPNFAVCSHPISIDNIIRDDSSFILQLTLENKRTNGYFCASKEIMLKEPKSGNTVYLKASKDVPVCPKMYHFKWVGEKLHFSLTFPAVDTSEHFVDLIEVCDENCLVINGLILDSVMNKLINQGFDAYTHDNFTVALASFQKAIRQYPDYPYGFIHGYVINILLEQKKTNEAKNWARKLRDSRIIDKYSILRQLREEKGFAIE